LLFSEQRLARNLKQIVGDFAATGVPLSLSNLDLWRPYNMDLKNFYEVNTEFSGNNFNGGRAHNFWSIFLPEIAKELKSPETFIPGDKGNSVVDAQKCAVLHQHAHALGYDHVVRFLILLGT
jgi:hypothetical protein